MAHRDIIINSKKVSPHKAYVGPKFNEKTILGLTGSSTTNKAMPVNANIDIKHDGVFFCAF